MTSRIANARITGDDFTTISLAIIPLLRASDAPLGKGRIQPTGPILGGSSPSVHLFAVAADLICVNIGSYPVPDLS
jgi:hypothetical protein